MSEMMSIYETVSQIDVVESVELISVPVEGDSVVLLRTSRMPEFAFVMWANKQRNTASQIKFRMSGDDVRFRYAVVCACCPSGTYGVEPPVSREENEERWDAWAKEQIVKFNAALISTCREHDISTIFMRRASSWNDHVEGLRVVEARDHFEAFLELYGRRPIRDALRFIDYRRSDGIGAG